MRSLKRTIACTAAAASLVAVPAAALATGSAAAHAAATAAQTDYRNAVARCHRMTTGGERRRCMQDAEAVRNAAMIRAQALPGDAKLMELNFLPAADGAQDGAVPDYRDLPDIHLVPDNLASNAGR